MKQIHKLNGQEINPPNNYSGLELEVNYDKDGNTETVSINEWEFGVGDGRFSNDGAKVSNKHIDDGTSGGVGVGEGLPYELTLDDERGTQLQLFNGFVDLWAAEVECDLVTAPAIELFDVVAFENKIDRVSFKYLASIGKITSADYIPIPYCINKKVNGYEVIIATVTVFVIADKLQESISDLKEYIGNISGNPFTFSLLIGLVFRILYIATLVVALVKLMLDLYNMLVQPVKYHYGMRERDLMRIGLEHLGYTLSSSILESLPFSNAVIMPEKYSTKEDNTGTLKFITGFFAPDPNEQEGYFKGTFGELYRALVDKYDAKIVIDGTTLHFEKQGFTINAPAYQFPDFERGPTTFNKTDFVSNKIISFATDLQERNTIQEYLGTKAQITTTAISVNNPKMSLLDRYEPINIPFSLAKRKKELSFVEKILNVFFKASGAYVDVLVDILNAIIKAINALIKALNKLIKALRTVGIKIKFKIPSIPTIKKQNFSNLIEDRLDMMVLESDYTSLPKNMLIENKSNPRNNKLLPDNESVQNAKYLYENYHKNRSFVVSGSSLPNQYEIEQFENIPFCFEDYKKIRANSHITDSNGAEGELISLKFNPYRQTANGSYKIKKVYTSNLKETITEPDGK